MSLNHQNFCSFFHKKSYDEFDDVKFEIFCLESRDLNDTFNPDMREKFSRLYNLLMNFYENYCHRQIAIHWKLCEWFILCNNFRIIFISAKKITRNLNISFIIIPKHNDNLVAITKLTKTFLYMILWQSTVELLEFEF